MAMTRLKDALKWRMCVCVCWGGCRKVKSGMQDGQMQQGDGGVEESLAFSALSIFLAFP